MFHKVHIRLTFLFTFVSSLLLLIMSVLYLYLSYSSVKTNAFISFQSDMNTFVTNCENSSVISYDWLLKLQSNHKYSFFLYDNNIPFSFVNNTKTKEELALIDEVRTYYHSNYSSISSSVFASSHTEFFYQDAEKNKYYVGVGVIPGTTSNLEIIVLYSLASINKQMTRLYIQFSCIIFFTVLAILLFSWYYTKHLLKPIEDSQNKQIQFIASASHELRTPVATILSALSAMEKGNDDERNNFARIAKKEGERLSLLVNDMLTLARSDNHSFPVTMDETELDTLLLDAYDAFYAPAKEKNIALTISLPETILPKCRADAERIKQVIFILLSNALSYTPENGSIMIKLYDTDSTFVFQIIDNGIGILDADKLHIFDRFYRVDPSRNKKDHFGLGLCIAKEIISIHNGQIKVSDTKGGGTTFTVILNK